MNFRRQGFYGEQEHNKQTTSGGGAAGKQLPLSYNNSSTSSQPHRHQSSSWFENNKYENPPRRPAEEISSISTTTNLQALMDASPSSFLRHNNCDGEDAVMMRRAEDNYEAADHNTTGQLVVEVEREHMFDKVVTPSDVGKLNRLVIPKQHAEKYFPLDSSSSDKGLLLNFEDRNGKSWRFRYSYWNSSQSYVMTKGWSRFVKEKKLDAGDIVSFQRGLGELGKDRLFIDWRRRPENIPQQGLIPPLHPHLHQQHYLSFQRLPTYNQPSSTTPLFLHPNAPLRDYSHYHHHPHAASTYVNNQPHYGYGYGGSTGGGASPYGSYNNTMGSSSTSHHPCSSSVIYLRSTEAAAHVTPQQVQAGMVQLQSSSGSGGGGGLPMVFESVPVVQGKVAAKRLRLFGVNMDCPISESDECGDVLSSLSSNAMPNASSSSSTMGPTWPHPPQNIHPLQLRLYNGSSPLPAMHLDKSNVSNKSLDFDI